MKISLGTKDNLAVFQARHAYDVKDRLKALGWQFDQVTKIWWVSADNFVAVRNYVADMEPSAKARLSSAKIEVEEKIAASKAISADIVVPVPEGLKYHPFQLAGIRYLMDHPNAILGDEMGLGKTIQIIGLINADPSIDTVLVVCPATLRRNWKREFERWSIRKRKVEVVETKGQAITDGQVIIISYDLLEAHQSQLSEWEWGLVVCDEAHYAKNKNTRRTSALLGVSRTAAKSRLLKAHKTELVPDPDFWVYSSWEERNAVLDKALAENPNLKAELDGLLRTGMQARRTVFVSGTPIPNRPVELWPILERLDPTGLGRSHTAYTDRYCDARFNNGHRDVSGASNLEELQIRLRSNYLIRRLKSEVLADLPAKTHQLVEIPAAGKLARLVEKELKIDAQMKKDRVEQLTAASALFAEMSKVRHQLAVAKIPAILDHINATLEGCEKLVVMAHHLDVISAIAEAFEKAAVITGETAPADRQSAVDRFQHDPECRLFVGSITAAGTGITLTAASTVVFAEQDWTPGNMKQAEDRLHRIGQTDAVLVQHLVVDGSLDAHMAQTLAAKSDLIGSALDAAPVLVAPHRTSASRKSSRVGRSGTEMPADPELPTHQIAAIHECLKRLAAADPDHAKDKNSRGFSAHDCKVGHRLAQEQVLSSNEVFKGLKLVRKYKRQLPAELFAVATGSKV